MATTSEFNKPVSLDITPVDITSTLTFDSRVTLYDGRVVKYGNVVHVDFRFDLSADIGPGEPIVAAGMPFPKYENINYLDVKKASGIGTNNEKHALTNTGNDAGKIRMFNNSSATITSGYRWYVIGEYICE